MFFFLSPHRRSVCVRVTCFGSEGIGYICHHDTTDVFLKKLAHTQRALAWFQIEHFGSYRLLTIEIINNTRGGIEAKIWERANGGQI